MKLNILASAVIASAIQMASADDPFAVPDGYDCFIAQASNGLGLDPTQGCISSICPGIEYLASRGYDATTIETLQNAAVSYFLSLMPGSDPSVLTTATECDPMLPGCEQALELCAVLTGVYGAPICPKLFVSPFSLDPNVNLRARVFYKDDIEVDVPPEGLLIKEGGFSGLTLDYIGDIPPLTVFFVAEYQYVDEDNDDETVSVVSWRSKGPGYAAPDGSRALLQDLAFDPLGAVDPTFFTETGPEARFDALTTVFTSTVVSGGEEYNTVRNLITCSDTGI